MAYPKYLLTQAFEELTDRRNFARAEHYRRTMEVHEKLPIISKIDEKLRGAALEVAQTVLGSEDVEKRINILKAENLGLQQERASLLQSAQYPENYLEVPYSCQKCGDTGMLEGRYCSCLTQILKSLVYKELNMNINLANYTFENFSLLHYSKVPDSGRSYCDFDVMQKTLEVCKTYAMQFDKKSSGLLLQGNTGLGKTHISLAIANVVLEKGHNVIYVSVPNLVEKLEKEHFKRTEEDTAPAGYLKHLEECDLLILDDLGAEFITNFSVYSLYNLLNSRMNLLLPTIINTNFDLKKIESKYSDRILSRIVGNSKIIPFLGTDMRIKNNQG